MSDQSATNPDDDDGVDKNEHGKSSRNKPIIASSFMPSVATQTAVSYRLRAAATTTIPSSSTNIKLNKSIKSSRNGNMKIQQQSNNEAEEEASSENREDEELISKEESSILKLSDLSKKDWVTIIMLAVANLCSTIAFSCIAPFYPAEAQKKELSVSEIGIIFGIFELVMFITAPIFGKYMHLIGAKKVFIFGVFFTGITVIAFGFLNLLPPGRIFFWGSFGIRCAEAIGDAAFVTSSFVISAKKFPGRISTIVGLMETVAGLGSTAGPFIGGVLYGKSIEICNV
uniref:Major facilitator superfamily (MFS) profile domain-containing protein n=1 Tax=Panagrolaimus sp. ES5 TaxID=591445 RepID=A0AC34FQ96_9BILA